MQNKKHIIVTGGSGFIGSHIASRLLSQGYRVTVLDNLSTGKEENIPSGADFINIDLRQQASYMTLKQLDCCAVFHLAGQSSGEISFSDPFYDLSSHVVSTFWLLEWARKQSISRFIYASSMSVYGDSNDTAVDETHPLQPKTFYAAAKISAEAYVRLYQTLGINTTILRMFSVYGQGQDLNNKMHGMVNIYLSYMLDNVPVIVKGSKDRFRDFVYIDDVVDAWITCLNNPVSYGKTYNVASGEKTKVEDLIKIMKEIFGFQDYPVEYKNNTPGDQFGIVADISRIKQDLGWRPKIALRSGLEKMIDFEKGKLKK